MQSSNFRKGFYSVYVKGNNKPKTLYLKELPELQDNGLYKVTGKRGIRQEEIYHTTDVSQNSTLFALKIDSIDYYKLKKVNEIRILENVTIFNYNANHLIPSFVLFEASNTSDPKLREKHERWLLEQLSKVQTVFVEHFNYTNPQYEWGIRKQMYDVVDLVESEEEEEENELISSVVDENEEEDDIKSISSVHQNDENEEEESNSLIVDEEEEEEEEMNESNSLVVDEEEEEEESNSLVVDENEEGELNSSDIDENEENEDEEEEEDVKPIVSEEKRNKKQKTYSETNPPSNRDYETNPPTFKQPKPVPIPLVPVVQVPEKRRATLTTTSLKLKSGPSQLEVAQIREFEENKKLLAEREEYMKSQRPRVAKRMAHAEKITPIHDWKKVANKLTEDDRSNLAQLDKLRKECDLLNDLNSAEYIAKYNEFTHIYVEICRRYKTKTISVLEERNHLEKRKPKGNKKQKTSTTNPPLVQRPNSSSAAVPLSSVALTPVERDPSSSAAFAAHSLKKQTPSSSLENTASGDMIVHTKKNLSTEEIKNFKYWYECETFYLKSNSLPTDKEIWGVKFELFWHDSIVMNNENINVYELKQSGNFNVKIASTIITTLAGPYVYLKGVVSGRYLLGGFMRKEIEEIMKNTNNKFKEEAINHVTTMVTGNKSQLGVHQRETSKFKS